MTDPDRYNIGVEVTPSYVEAQSNPEEGQYVFAYTVTIRNLGSVAAQLVSRHWVITDSNGKVQEVEGQGVVGETPHLEPGEAFEYTSGTMIETPVGTMRGSYHMVADDGVEFEAEIAPFTLAIPRVLH